jgi:hypothetical protein
MELIPVPLETISIGQLANEYASQNVFSDYQSKIAANTLKRHAEDSKIAKESVKLANS